MACPHADAYPEAAASWAALTSSVPIPLMSLLVFDSCCPDLSGFVSDVNSAEGVDLPSSAAAAGLLGKILCAEDSRRVAKRITPHDHASPICSSLFLGQPQLSYRLAVNQWSH